MLNITHTLKRFLFTVSFVVLFSISCFSAPVVSKPRVFKVKAVYEKKVLIKWKKVADADGYIISCKNKTTQIIREKKLKGNPKSEYISYTLKGLDYCTKYEICIAAYKGKERSAFTQPVPFRTVLTKPETPNLRISSRDAAKTVIEWDAVKKADYYEIYQKKNGKKTFLKKTKKTSFSIKNLKPLKTYTFVVKAVRYEKGYDPRKSVNGGIKVIPENLSYYRSLVNQIDDGNVYEGGGNPYRTYSRECLEAYANYGNEDYAFDSNTRYLLWCNRRSYHLFVFERGGNGKWSLLHSWPCIIGRGSNPTIRGFYTLSQVSTYHDYGGNHAEYLTSYSGDNMIHSLLFPTQSNYLSSGYMSSLGCIRITRENAAFVYYNCPGSTFIIR